MESAAVLRAFDYSFSTRSQLRTVVKKSGVVNIGNSPFCNVGKLPIGGGKRFSRSGSLHVSCLKTPETTVGAKSKGDPNGAALSESKQNGVLEKSPLNQTFPNGFEDLLTDVCDETKIAELKVKFGAFEIHMKRNIGVPSIPAPIIHETTTPSVSSIPVKESASASPPTPPKRSAEKVSPFTNVLVEKASKLAALEASGSTGYVIVSSSTVGVFRRARTLKGKKQPPACKEGDMIKEGQVICFLDKLSCELPIRSNVAGEVLKVLYNDGEPVGYGDPLIAVLPSFHGIQ